MSRQHIRLCSFKSIAKLSICLLLITLMPYCSSHPVTKNDGKPKPFDRNSCKNVNGFTTELLDEIHAHNETVNKIIDLILNGHERHSTYNELALFCDTFGPRLSGSKSLSKAIKYMHNKMEKESKLDVTAEAVMIPRWEIGTQWAEIVEPVRHHMNILAFGTSIGTDNKTLEGHVELIQTFEELDRLGAKGGIKGKIVVFNYNFTTYGDSVKYRTTGASRAAKYGAIAALVRSVGPFSINSPHTGVASKSIPTAAITLEDADLIQRWFNRNKQITIRLFIDAENYDDVKSYNTIGDIKGSTEPEEIVLVSGHIDSWYNTQGAMDDGGGMMISYKALDILSKLNLRAKRTIRAILWTSEEFGEIGARQYFKDHEHELQNFKMVMESDLGTFKPLGLSYINISPLGRCIVSEILSMTERIGTTRLDSNYEGSDIDQFTDRGVPGLTLNNENSKYFWFHHTSGDSMSVEDPDELDKSTILWAVASYVIADLSVEIS